MEDLHDHYCEKCGYGVSEDEDSGEDSMNSEFGMYLKSFFLRLASLVL